jgi:hypothetical protein
MPWMGEDRKGEVELSDGNRFSQEVFVAHATLSNAALTPHARGDQADRIARYR